MFKPIIIACLLLLALASPGWAAPSPYPFASEGLMAPMVADSLSGAISSALSGSGLSAYISP